LILSKGEGKKEENPGVGNIDISIGRGENETIKGKDFW